MPLHDILLHIDTYPDATSAEAIDQAVHFAKAVGGVLSAVAVGIDLKAPNNRLADYLIGLSNLAAEEERRSHAACVSALERFRASATEAGVLGDAIQSRATVYGVDGQMAERARTRDLCIVPVMRDDDGQRAVIEAVVFGSGRPVLAFDPDRSRLPSALGCIVLAWDGTRTAARAMADALPALKLADKVRVLTVTNEKPGADSGLGEDALRHLKAHSVNAVLDEVDADGRRIGVVLDDYVARTRPDLFVMGAFGRSRAREFILGGATQHMLHKSGVALFLSH